MKMSYLNFILASIVMFGHLLGGCTQTDTSNQVEPSAIPGIGIEASAKLETSALGSTPNVHKYKDFYLAGQPGEADFEETKKVGVKTVVNLRMPSELSFDEEQSVCAGVDYMRCNSTKNRS